MTNSPAASSPTTSTCGCGRHVRTGATVRRGRINEHTAETPERGRSAHLAHLRARAAGEVDPARPHLDPITGEKRATQRLARPSPWRSMLPGGTGFGSEAATTGDPGLASFAVRPARPSALRSRYRRGRPSPPTGAALRRQTN